MGRYAVERVLLPDEEYRIRLGLLDFSRRRGEITMVVCMVSVRWNAIDEEQEESNLRSRTPKVRDEKEMQ